MNSTLAPEKSMSAADRCDRCGAQAYVRVTLTSGGELLFCAHHGREHANKLRDIAVTIQDDSGRLGDEPATGDSTSNSTSSANSAESGEG